MLCCDALTMSDTVTVAPTPTKWARYQEVCEPLTWALDVLVALRIRLSDHAFNNHRTPKVNNINNSVSLSLSLPFSRGTPDTSHFATWTGGGWRWCCKRACRYRADGEPSGHELTFVDVYVFGSSAICTTR